MTLFFVFHCFLSVRRTDLKLIDQSGLAGLCNSDLLVVLVMTGIKKPTADCNAVRDEFRFLERLSDEMLEIHFHL